jgi:hypothetical protein
MSKDTSTSLFELIHRMSKGEKRYFKLQAAQIGDTGKLKFVKLFDRIEKQHIYDEAALLKLEPDITRKQLPNLKYFLYDYLLTCIQQLQQQHSSAARLQQLLGNARVLYDKCLYADCLRIADRAKRLALEHQNFSILPELLELEKLALRHTVSAGHRQRVQQIAAQSAQVAASIDRIGRYTNLILELNSRYIKTGFIRSRADLDEVTRFFTRLLPEADAKQLLPAEQQYHYLAQTGFSFYTQDFKTGYRAAQSWVKIYDEHPALINTYTEMYIRALNALMVGQNKLGLTEGLEQTHRRLVALKRHKAAATENIQLNLFRTIYIHEINKHFMRGEFSAGIRIVARLEGELNKFVPLLDHNSVLLFYYKIACLYVGAGQHKRALHWLGRIIRERDIAVREDLHGFARMLALICYHELGKDEEAESHLRALYRYLLSKGQLSAYHRHILKFLRGLHRNMRERELRKHFLELRAKLIPLQSKRFEKRAFHYFDILAWLDSRIEQQPVEEVIRGKMGR